MTGQLTPDWARAPSKPRTAWYSAKAAALWGSVFWLRSDGSEVELTAVTGGDYLWDDKVSVGPVMEYSRKGQVGTEEEKQREHNRRWLR